MRLSLLLLLLLLVPAVLPAAEITTFVNDYAHIFSPQEKTQIEDVLKQVYDSGQAQFAIVTVDSLNGSDIESYSYNLAEGHLGETGKNNGLLLLIAVNDRQYRFETGRGLEPVLPDITLGRIERQYLQPNFRNSEYGKGVLEASQAVRDILLGNATNTTEPANPSEIAQSFPVPPFVIIMIIIFVIIVIFIAARKKGNSGSGKRPNEDYFTAAWILSQMMKGGKGGSGGFGGGGGGFGGGSFGGGGASGRW